MSLQKEDGKSLDKGSENSDVVSRKPEISYSRKFLLSLSNLDVCKKLPRGFDESLISEFEEFLKTTNQPRIHGSSSMLGFKRNEYGSSSPPTRGDSGNYSKGIYGKWEGRSSGRNDRVSDSQSERDSDSGRRYGPQSRRSWQSPEHDGLLGSGSFPRSSGYASGSSGSAQKVRANEQSQPTKSTEPYQPPRPYKAVPHLRRETDLHNDETFGSMEHTSEDRAEEERKRRAAFETMRKEQQKTLQEKQKTNLGRPRSDGFSDLCEGLMDSKEESGLVRNSELEVSAGIPILSNDLEKAPFTSHSPASRPLVPPGFKHNTLEKTSGFKSLIHPTLSEVGKPVTGESLVDAEANLVRNTNDRLERHLPQEVGVVDGQPAKKIHHALLLNKGENRNGLDMLIKKPGVEDQLLQVSSHLDSHGSLDDPKIAKLNAEILEGKTLGDSTRSNSTSILEKIFGSTLSVNDGHSSSAERHDGKPDDTWSPSSAQSSKFALWFSEEESKAAADVSSAGPNNLLSMIVGGDKANGVSEQVCINSKEEPTPTVLTCEDLEQSILSEYSAKTTNLQPVLKSWNATVSNTEQQSAHAGDHASLNLLSLLHKSADQNNTSVNSIGHINLGDQRLVSREHELATAFNDPKGKESDKVLPDSGSTLTLETLFGTAFMKELKSVEAPVSVQRGSIGSARFDAPEPHGLPLPVTDNDISSTTTDKGGLQRPGHDYKVSSNQRQNTTMRDAENWLVFDDSSIKRTSSNPKNTGYEFQLPAEENLLSAGETQDHQMLRFLSTGKSINNTNHSSGAPMINIMEKLAAFGPAAAFKDEGSERLSFHRDSYEQMEPDVSYRNHQMQQSSPHFQPPQMSQVRPLYHHLESHPAQMSPPIFNHDSPANNQFASNMARPSFHRPNVRVAGFDVPSQHSMLHQMQMPVNHSPQFPRGGPVSRNGMQPTNFIHERNQMPGFPFGPRQPNVDNSGVPMPGNTPEAIQRLIEMELRAKSKQINPFAAPGHTSQGMYGHEVDMGFRHR
ncbi:hypothetical protein ABFS82_02G167300 [Erythranthe guttata]|nr:PREDICTED: uncharacterized protein LOC105963844 [Erythranthe guttata]|eukprot:XP_012843776.1 PREDICTED: uncharacterized protein LOC105963844 [Erythranthe guttata]